MRILVLDLGIGNLSNVVKAVDGVLSSDPKDVEYAERLILPGVGNFGEVSKKLDKFRKVVIDFIKSGGFFLGICLGLQLLFEESEEAGGKGLAVFKGRVVRFPNTCVPHIGWNKVTLRKNVPIFWNIRNGSYFYFVHSYFVKPEDEEIVVGITNHGNAGKCVIFPSVIWHDNIFGVQFHPEKSGEVGLKLLKNFKKL